MTNTDKLCTHLCDSGNPCALRGGVRHTIFGLPAGEQLDA